MFTIAFRDGTRSEKECVGTALYNEEYLRDPYQRIHIQAQIGETFLDFVSLSGDISNSGHPYLTIAGDVAEGISTDSWFLVQLRKFLDLGIENEAVFTVPSLMYFLHITGLQIPAFRYELSNRSAFEDIAVEELLPAREGMDHFEHSMRAYLSLGERVLQYPLMSYECETIEDACIASLHFLITHKFHIRKCKNCGRYFVAYYRSDTEYCDRQSPYNPGKTCKQDGPGRAYRDAMGTDEVKKVFHKIDSARRMRVSRNPDDEDILEEYDAWRDAMKKMRKKYKSGAITAEQFIEWLEEHRSYDEDWDY